MTDFTLGVNYWPRKKAMYWWSNFDAGEVREEFAIIKEIGLNVVRLFLLWYDYQPEPVSVAKEQLEHLVTVADIAAENSRKNVKVVSKLVSKKSAHQYIYMGIKTPKREAVITRELGFHNSLGRNAG